MDADLLDQALAFHGPVFLQQLDEEHGESLSVPHAIRRRYGGKPVQDQSLSSDHMDCELTYAVRKLMARKADMLFRSCRQEKDMLYKTDDNSVEDAYGIMPPLESFMGIPPDICRQHFYESISAGDVVVGVVTSVTDSGLMASLLCTECDGVDRDINELGVTAFAPVKELPRMFAHQSVTEAYQPRDVFQGIILSVNPEMEKIVVSLRDKLPAAEREDIKIGLISKDDFPVHYRRKLERSGLSYSELLHSILGFTNKSSVDTLQDVLGLSNSASLMRGLHRVTVPEEEQAQQLRKWQAQKQAHSSVVAGVEMVKQGRQLEALQHLNNALQMDPSNTEALVARGAVYANNECFLKAVEDFEAALQADPHHANAQKYLGETLLAFGRRHEEQGDVQEAEADYREVLKIHPQSKEAHLGLDRCQRLKAESDGGSRKKGLEPIVVSSSDEDQESDSIQRTTQTLRRLIQADKKDSRKGKSRHGSESSGAGLQQQKVKKSQVKSRRSASSSTSDNSDGSRQDQNYCRDGGHALRKSVEGDIGCAVRKSAEGDGGRARRKYAEGDGGPAVRKSAEGDGGRARRKGSSRRKSGSVKRRCHLSPDSCSSSSSSSDQWRKLIDYSNDKKDRDCSVDSSQSASGSNERRSSLGGRSLSPYQSCNRRSVHSLSDHSHRHGRQRACAIGQHASESSSSSTRSSPARYSVSEPHTRCHTDSSDGESDLQKHRSCSTADSVGTRPPDEGGHDVTVKARWDKRRSSSSHGGNNTICSDWPGLNKSHSPNQYRPQLPMSRSSHNDGDRDDWRYSQQNERMRESGSYGLPSTVSLPSPPTIGSYRSSPSVSQSQGESNIQPQPPFTHKSKKDRHPADRSHAESSTALEAIVTKRGVPSIISKWDSPARRSRWDTNLEGGQAAVAKSTSMQHEPQMMPNSGHLLSGQMGTWSSHAKEGKQSEKMKHFEDVPLEDLQQRLYREITSTVQQMSASSSSTSDSQHSSWARQEGEANKHDIDRELVAGGDNSRPSRCQHHSPPAHPQHHSPPAHPQHHSPPAHPQHHYSPFPSRIYGNQHHYDTMSTAQETISPSGRRRNTDSPSERQRSGDSPSRRQKNGDSPSVKQMNRDSPSMKERSRDSPFRRQRSRDSPSRKRRSGDSPPMRQRSRDSPSRRQRSRDFPSIKQRNRDSVSMKQRSHNSPSKREMGEGSPSRREKSEDSPSRKEKTEDYLSLKQKSGDSASTKQRGREEGHKRGLQDITVSSESIWVEKIVSNVDVSAAKKRQQLLASSLPSKGKRAVKTGKECAEHMARDASSAQTESRQLANKICETGRAELAFKIDLKHDKDSTEYGDKECSKETADVREYRGNKHGRKQTRSRSCSSRTTKRDRSNSDQSRHLKKKKTHTRHRSSSASSTSSSSSVTRSSSSEGQRKKRRCSSGRISQKRKMRKKISKQARKHRSSSFSSSTSSSSSSSSSSSTASSPKKQRLQAGSQTGKGCPVSYSQRVKEHSSQNVRKPETAAHTDTAGGQGSEADTKSSLDTDKQLTELEDFLKQLKSRKREQLIAEGRLKS